MANWVDTGTMTLLPGGTQEVLHHLNTLTWACLNYADEVEPDVALRHDLNQLHNWLVNDPRALAILKQHGVDMMAHDLLKWGGFEAPAALRERYKLGVVARLATERIYGDVLNALTTAKVTVVVQKGFWLAGNVYPEPVWRQYADLDLLVSSAQIHQTDAVLRELGFKPLYSALPGRSEVPKWADADVIDCLEYKKDIYSIDVHFNLVPQQLPNRCDMRQVWNDLLDEPLLIKQTDNDLVLNLKTLHPYDTMLHLLLHAGYHHMEAGFRALLDVLLTRRYYMEQGGWHGKWEWRDFMERCRRWDVDYLVAGPLIVMRTLMMPEEQLVPAEVPKRLDRRGKILIRHRHMAFIEHFVTEPAHLASQARDFLSPLIGAGFKRWFQAFWHFCLPSPRRMAARYGIEPSDARLPLYYITRPFALLVAYLPSALRRVFT